MPAGITTITIRLKDFWAHSFFLGLVKKTIMGLMKIKGSVLLKNKGVRTNKMLKSEIDKKILTIYRSDRDSSPLDKLIISDFDFIPCKAKNAWNCLLKTEDGGNYLTILSWDSKLKLKFMFKKLWIQKAWFWSIVISLSLLIRSLL